MTKPTIFNRLHHLIFQKPAPSRLPESPPRNDKEQEDWFSGFEEPAESHDIQPIASPNDGVIDVSEPEDGEFFQKSNGDRFSSKHGDGLIHQKNGPAIELIDGTRKWYLDGLLHREDGPAIEFENNRREWYREGLRHRLDGPAIQYANGGTEWWKEGQRHRVGGPAIQRANGPREWYENGLRHRCDGPAVEFPNYAYYLEGINYPKKKWKELIAKKAKEVLLSSTKTIVEENPATDAPSSSDDQPVSNYINGDRYWRRNGVLHRDNNPAIERINGGREWYRDGQRHRVGGPAVEHPDGRTEYWLNGEPID